MKLLFVTGGVISGLGKGITAASIGKLLSAAGNRVTLIKLDPYLNVDAGTMSPYEHGEVFVTEDGGETDLDLGHYERFINTPLQKNNSITTGKIYMTVLEKERLGDYLGKNIQVIPHVVNEVKEQILAVAEQYDITIVEIGGTIGDIEGPHFIEAARQLKKDLGKENIFYLHVVPVLYLDYSGEFKTKQIQHSHAKLTSMGIHADMLVCRTDHPLPDGVKEKLSLFCDMEEEAIIENRNVHSIYQLPALFQEQQVDRIILDHFGCTDQHADIGSRNERVSVMLNATQEVVIGMVGKYAEQQDSYISVVESLKHAGAALNKKIIIERIQAEDFEDNTKLSEIAQRIDGLLIPGGFGGRGMEGKIAAAHYARTQQVPFLGLCLGLQMAVIEYARNVLGIAGAHTIEAGADCSDPIIAFMPGQSDELIKGGSMRLGAYTTRLDPASSVYKIYKKRGANRLNEKDTTIVERHRHRYEVNPDYYDRLEQGGLHLSGRDQALGLVEFIELPEHPYFIATQAHPEFTSRLDAPHPLFVGFIDACGK